ncbi:MAG: S-4TM family putative pore-forming effector [Aridibacter sp.]
MNQIQITQNSDRQLEQLAAQRELYSSAKKFYLVESIGSILIPLTFIAFSTFIINISPFSALYGICFYLFDSVILETLIAEKKSTAAKIQELFDCEVLEIEKPIFRTVSDVSFEEILTNYDSHIGKIATDEKLRDWYPKALGELDISVARLICQRINCGWDAKLRSKFSSLLKIVVVVTAILIIIGITLGRLPGDQLPLILAGILPLFKFCLKLYKDNKSSGEKLIKLNTYFRILWERMLKGEVTEKELNESARLIQNEIFDNRIKNPLIPDFFYNLFRTKDEPLMNNIAEKLVAEL